MGIILLNVPVFPQKPDTVAGPGYKIVVAGKQYNKSSFHQSLWGKHYRKDWATPVTVRLINLDTVNGGLLAYEKGGGRQSKSLRLKNAAGKEYVLRSIDKSFGKALPELYRGTFIENIIDDQVSIAQPYSAITIPSMAQAAGIYHTNPVIVFVPKQKALGEFNEEFGDDLYLFEQRPDENWEEADNFANSKKIVGTENMFEKVFEDNDNRIDQPGFVRARLFDMFIGDWGRHEDQWRWAKIEDGEKNIYKAIPRDRDQAYTKFDGKLLSLGISAAADHLETFGKDIKNVGTYNFPARNLDRQAANEPTREQWVSIAKELQQSLTDNLIEESVRELPPEVFPLSGDEIISKLKSRRDKLVEFANEYYSFLAREVDVVGTHDNEYFEVKALSPTETEIRVYDLNKEGSPKKEPYYTRKFYSAETNEIRLYGLKGNDQYNIDAANPNGIKIRIIGGPQKDTYTVSNGTARQVHIYDNRDNDFTNGQGTRKHLSEDSSIHVYTYDGFKYDKKGTGFILTYNTADHIHTGLKYEIEKQQWRKYPYGQHHEIAARYSISEAAFSFGYESIFKSLIAKWDLVLNANYDLMRWNNYFGIGNETVVGKENRNYNRIRSKQFDAGVGLARTFATHHHIDLGAIYQTIDILNDPGRFLSQEGKFMNFEAKKFGGGQFEYVFQDQNDLAVPTKGFRFSAGITHLQNLEQKDSAITNYSSVMNIYLPLSKSFVFSLKTGAATLTGKPEFYQLNKLTGSKTLRGHRKYRFYGKSMFYNQAEIQFIKNVKTYLFNGKAGLIGLYDIGRVWQPGENSDTWHYGYGGGFLLAPFNKFSVAVFYAFSRDERDFSVRFIKGF